MVARSLTAAGYLVLAIGASSAVRGTRAWEGDGLQRRETQRRLKRSDTPDHYGKKGTDQFADSSTTAPSRSSAPIKVSISSSTITRNDDAQTSAIKLIFTLERAPVRIELFFFSSPFFYHHFSPLPFESVPAGRTAYSATAALMRIQPPVSAVQQRCVQSKSGDSVRDCGIGWSYCCTI